MIRLRIGETIFEVESIEEAIEIHRQLSGFGEQPKTPRRVRQTIDAGVSGGRNGALTPSITDITPTPAKFAAFAKSLNDNGKRVIVALLDAGEGLMTDDLAKAIGTATASLPPIIRHVRTRAVEANMGGGDVLERREVVEHGRPKSRYNIYKDSVLMLREAMKKQGPAPPTDR
jgi:hypothetical protein